MTAHHRNIRMSYAKLERFGLRATDSLLRHRDAGPGFAAFERTLPARTVAHSRALARVATLTRQTQAQVRRARTATRDLSSCVRTWLGALQRDLIELDGSDYPWSEVTVDLVQQGRRLASFATEHPSATGAPVPYAAEAATHLRESADRAEAARNTATAALAQLHVERRTLRETAVALNTELVAFRRVLRHALGDKHADYQALRARRPRNKSAAVVPESAAAPMQASAPAPDSDSESPVSPRARG